MSLVRRCWLSSSLAQRVKPFVYLAAYTYCKELLSVVFHSCQTVDYLFHRVVIIIRCPRNSRS